MQKKKYFFTRAGKQKEDDEDRTHNNRIYIQSGRSYEYSEYYRFPRLYSYIGQ